MVDHHDARTVLERAWVDVSNLQLRPPPALQKLIGSVMKTAGAAGFRYLLATGILARCVNPEAHPRAIQAGSSLPGAYDAGNLCQQVIVPFEQTKGNLLGAAKEPFSSKSLRYAEHDKNNPQLRNNEAAGPLHEALEQVRQADDTTAYSALVYLLRLTKARDEASKAAVLSGGPTLQLSYRFLNRFLQKPAGGARLVAVWGALLRLTHNEAEAEIRVYNPNESSEYSGMFGNVEVYAGEKIVSGSECKHRPLSLDDVEHSLRKNKPGIECVFVTSAGLQPGEEQAVKNRIAAAARTSDVSLVDANRDFAAFLKLLGPHRQRLGQCVTELLRKMREFDSADEAARLWNKLRENRST